MKRASEKISAVFQFSKSGALKSIYLNAEGEEDQKVLEKGLFVLLKPEKFTSFKKLFRGLKG